MHARAKDTLDLETANNNNLMYGDPVHKNYIYMYTYIHTQWKCIFHGFFSSN